MVSRGITISVLSLIANFFFFFQPIPDWSFETFVLFAFLAIAMFVSSLSVKNTAFLLIPVALMWTIHYILNWLLYSTSNETHLGTGETFQSSDCKRKCGDNAVCFGACLDACKVSYCIRYGERTELTSDNCAEHQRKYEASALSNEAGAILCREWHQHHYACIACTEPLGCVETTKCDKSQEQSVRNSLRERSDNDDTSFQKTDNELIQEWTQNQVPVITV